MCSCKLHRLAFALQDTSIVVMHERKLAQVKSAKEVMKNMSLGNGWSHEEKYDGESSEMFCF
jgi:ATP-dependent DNA ligase